MAVAVAFGFLAFTLSAKAKPEPDEARYLNPREMVLSGDGSSALRHVRSQRRSARGRYGFE